MSQEIIRMARAFAEAEKGQLPEPAEPQLDLDPSQLSDDERQGLFLAALLLGASVQGGDDLEKLLDNLLDGYDFEEGGERSYAGIKGKPGYVLERSKTNPGVRRWVKKNAVKHRLSEGKENFKQVGKLTLGMTGAALVGAAGAKGVLNATIGTAAAIGMLGVPVGTAVTLGALQAALPISIALLAGYAITRLNAERLSRNKTLDQNPQRSEFWMGQEREYVDSIAQKYGIKAKVVAHALGYFSDRYDFAQKKGIMNPDRVAELAKQDFEAELKKFKKPKSPEPTE